MAINLIKGQRVEIESGLTRLKVEMGWKVNPNADPAYDLDASTFLLGNNGQIENEYDFVFYGSGNQTQALDDNGKPIFDESGKPVMRPISLDKSVKNAINGEVICRYDLDEDFSTDKGVEFGRLYRRGSEWKFQAVGEAHKDGLEPICRKYASKFM